MKTKLLLSLILSFYFCLLSSQVPQGFTYQAIAREGSGNPLLNQALPVRITIQSDSLGGTTFWIEEHPSVITNSFGLFTLILGKGVKQTGSTVNTFNDIDWTLTPKFIKTEIDYGGWKNMGSSRLWAVPYSLVAGNINGTLKKLAVTGETANMDEALFEVKNKNGQTVFAVYNEGIRIYVEDGVAKSANKGGFAIGGFGTVKTPSQEYFRVTRDSTRIYVNDGVAKGSTKGGFAIGGFDQLKGKGLEYMRITEDSARINMKEAVKGTKGGFAIGGFNQVKGSRSSFTSLTPENYFIGHETGKLNTTGLFNSFLGYQAGRDNTSGSYNIFIGHNSGTLNNDGWGNLFMGDSSGYKNTSGFLNVFQGAWAGQENTSGYYNIALGAAASAYNQTGWQNINIGYVSGEYNTTGNRNIFVGTSSGRNNKEGFLNVFVGNLTGTDVISGSNNVYLGSYAGRHNAAGSNNVFLGNNAGRDESSSNRLIISNSETPTPLIFGEFDNGRVIINGNNGYNYNNRNLFVVGTSGGSTAWFNDSDRKLKHDIVTIPDALDKVLKLRGVNFLWNQPGPGMGSKQMGFIGQEVAEIVPEVVSVSNDHYSMQYAPVTALLVEAMKEQQKRIEGQLERIESVRQENQKLRSELDELKSLVNTLIANQKSQSNN